MINVNTTVTAANSVELARQINFAFDERQVTEVNGRELVSRWGAPVARSWANGTVSVTVKGRAKGKVADLFVKVGETARVS